MSEWSFVDGISFLSTTDICILAIICFISIYWYFKSKKAANCGTDEIDSFTLSAESKEEVSYSGFMEKMNASNKKILVLYGSQTGTGEEFAGRLVKEARRYGLKGMVADPEDIDFEDICQLSKIESSMVIMCMATYGEGDPTDNAQEFEEWLKDGSSNLTGVNFAVFGLGNKTYEHYNSAGIYVDKRFEELGATRVFQLGLGDDDGNLEEDFVTWKEKFWPAVCDHFGLEISDEDGSLRQYKLTVHDQHEHNHDKVFTGEVARLKSYVTQRSPFDGKNPYLAKVLVNRELHKGGERSCMHIEFDISDGRLRYETGDHLAVYPTNDPELVEKIGKLLDVDLDTLFTLTNIDDDSSKKHPFPCPCTYRTALSHYVDIACIPRTHVLKEISYHASDESEKNKLRLMSTAADEGIRTYSDWIVKSCRNIIHVLEDLPSVKPPIDFVLELLPRLQARYYSISSSPKAHPNSVHITAILVEYMTPTNKKNKGVATSWLATKKVTNCELPTVPIYIRKSAFRLPSKLLTPVIMVGPGTGLAPFRAFIQDRHYQKTLGKKVGDVVLFYGCRKEEEDFLYEDELKKYVEDGTLKKLYTAFSRGQEKKVYVQHLIKEQADEIWDIIGIKNGHIYVCGDAKRMARDVHNVVRDIVMEKGKMTEEGANQFMKKMESQKRYSADVWS